MSGSVEDGQDFGSPSERRSSSSWKPSTGMGQGSCGPVALAFDATAVYLSKSITLLYSHGCWLVRQSGSSITPLFFGGGGVSHLLRVGFLTRSCRLMAETAPLTPRSRPRQSSGLSVNRRMVRQRRAPVSGLLLLLRGWAVLTSGCAGGGCIVKPSPFARDIRSAKCNKRMYT